MKERPIIMSGDNPRLILARRKTQTRRIVKPQPIPMKFENGLESLHWHARKGVLYDTANVQWNPIERAFEDFIEGGYCPYGVAGDRLWVRETWARHPEIHATVPGACLYRANRGGDYQGSAQGDFKWRPSIHMPRWASRITLEITKVRVERLQDISEEDCLAEGVIKSRMQESGNKVSWWYSFKTPREMLDSGDSECFPNAKDCYANLWDSLHGSGAWDKNPWVWVIDFPRS